jgi:hypothetical protein
VVLATVVNDSIAVDPLPKPLALAASPFAVIACLGPSALSVKVVPPSAPSQCSNNIVFTSAVKAVVDGVKALVYLALLLILISSR